MSAELYRHLESDAESTAEVDPVNLQLFQSYKTALEEGNKQEARFLANLLKSRVLRSNPDSMVVSKRKPPLRKNPLPDTPFMAQWRKDSKATTLVRMKIADFLLLTTPNNDYWDMIWNEAHPLENYVEWAQTKEMKPVFLDILPVGYSMGRVVAHEGRHRGAALLKKKEEYMNVTLRILTQEGNLSRQTTILDLPRYWQAEFERPFNFDAKNIQEVLETNIQVDNQRNPAIKNISLSGRDLAELMKW